MNHTFKYTVGTELKIADGISSSTSVTIMGTDSPSVDDPRYAVQIDVNRVGEPHIQALDWVPASILENMNVVVVQQGAR